MEPTIKDGEKVLVFQWAYLFSEPKVGDVIVFRKGKEHWIKRIKKIAGSNVEVEGDNKSDSMDIPEIKRKNILGKVLR